MLNVKLLSSIIMFLFLTKGWGYAGTITVNSTDDTNVRDEVITLREALMLSEGSLAYCVLTTPERNQVNPWVACPGEPGYDPDVPPPVGIEIYDTINFDNLVPPQVISPTSALPVIRDPVGVMITASAQWIGAWPGGQPGITLNGANAGAGVNGLEIDGASKCIIVGLFITNFGGDGVYIHGGAFFNFVGMPGQGERNVISGDGGCGVRISGSGTNNNVVSGNYIGTDVNGTADLGNLQDGIEIFGDAQSNIIGTGNTIAFNGSDGVEVNGNNTDFNRISQNSTHDNAGLGINLVDGGNDEISVPTITSNNLVGDTLTVSGVGSGANATVEFFRVDTPESGEGATYLGTLTADANGNFSGDISGEGLAVCNSIVATTTHTNNNTSEFSQSEHVLPVELSIFAARFEDGAVRINWRTESETNKLKILEVYQISK